MSDTIESLHRQIDSAGELRAVVRTMKAMAASNIAQYERSVVALDSYYDTVELGLSVCFRQRGAQPVLHDPQHGVPKDIGAIIFGSDQGLVGRFNDVVADVAVSKLAAMHGDPKVWTVGERVHERIVEAGIPVINAYDVPSSVMAIAPLVSQLLLESEERQAGGGLARVHVFYNQPKAAAQYAPVDLQLLPLDASWAMHVAEVPWPTKLPPEVLGKDSDTLRWLLHEYLFISLYRACAGSLTSENASRLAAMQRADKNIDDLLKDLKRNFERLRQTSIDEELFDVVAGYVSQEDGNGKHTGKAN